MIVDIKKSFEMPSQEEWDNLLATEHFESMRLDEALLKDYEKYIMLYPRLMEAFTGHNNKVGALEITYVLCKHYFDKGIPDDRWRTTTLHPTRNRRPCQMSHPHN